MNQDRIPLCGSATPWRDKRKGRASRAIVRDLVLARFFRHRAAGRRSHRWRVEHEAEDEYDCPELPPATNHLLPHPHLDSPSVLP